MTRPSLFAAMGACLALLAWTWFSAGYYIVTALIMLAAILWFAAEIRRWEPAAYIGLFLAALAAGAGELFRLPPVALLLALACALAAWDISAFSRRLALAAREDDLRALESRHFARLALVLAAGLVLGLLALELHTVRLKFELAALLALVGIWGLSLLVARMRQRGA